MHLFRPGIAAREPPRIRHRQSFLLRPGELGKAVLVFTSAVLMYDIRQDSVSTLLPALYRRERYTEVSPFAPLDAVPCFSFSSNICSNTFRSLGMTTSRFWKI